MAPVQNTFSIIPNFPSAANNDDDSTTKASRRPMTTKQAKKAYQKATRGPKLSKAEQRRQDLLEQDRIRKEAEKERNQARARAARDRKREKEDNERADKKKKGLPLVNVRPSQDTIARFVRGFGPPKNKPQPPEKPTTVCSPVREAPEPSGTHQDSCSPPSSPVLRAEERQSDCDPEDEPSPKRRRVGDPMCASLDSDHRSKDCPVVITPEAYTQSFPRRSQQVSQRLEAGDSQPAESSTSLPDKDSTSSPMLPPSQRDTISDSIAPKQLKIASQAMQDALANEKSLKRTPPEPVASTSATISLSQEFRDIAAIFDDDCLNDSFGSIFASPRDKEKASDPTQSPLLEPSRQSAHVQSTEHHPVVAHQEAKAASNDHSPPPKPLKPMQRPLIANCQPSFPLADKKAGPSPRQPLQTLSATRVNSKIQVQSLDRNPGLQHKPTKSHNNSDHTRKPPGMLSVTSMGPPPIPRNTETSRHEARRPQLSTPGTNNPSSNYSKQGHLPKEPESRGTKAPSSTQAFVFSHVDDLFPSPSQEIEELYAVEKCRNRKGVNAPRFLRTTSASKHHAPPRFLPKAQPVKIPEPPTRPTLQRKGGAEAQQNRESQRGAPRELADLHPLIPRMSNLGSCQAPTTTECVDFPFLSTQDLFLSSQDVQEMETPTNSSRQSCSADLLPSSLSQRSATPTPAVRSRTTSNRHQDEHAIRSQKKPMSLASPRGLTPEIPTTQDSTNIIGPTGTPHRVSRYTRMIVEGKSMENGKASLPSEPKQPSTATRPVLGGQHSPRSPNKPLSFGSRSGPDKAVATPQQEKGCQITARIVEQSTAAPRARAQPFFTSSCRAPLYKYAIERNKTSAWGNKGSKKDNEAGLDLLQQLENERFVNLLDDTEQFPFEEDDHALVALIAQTDQQGSSLQRAEQSQEETLRQNFAKVPNLPTGDPLSSAQPVSERADLTSSSAPRQQQKRSLSSYQMMLAELDKTEQNKNVPKTNPGEAAKPSGGQNDSEFELQPLEPCGSQETDYGDIGWDDEMLFMM